MFQERLYCINLARQLDRSDSSSEISLVHLAGLQSEAFLTDCKISCPFGSLLIATASLSTAYKSVDAAIAAVFIMTGWHFLQLRKNKEGW